MKGVHSQIASNNQIENLVFQGGGTKGSAYVGAITEAINQQLFSLEKVKRFCGSSAGAITALLLALGYSPQELDEELHSIDFTTDILDNSFETSYSSSGTSMVAAEGLTKLRKYFDLQQTETDRGITFDAFILRNLFSNTIKILKDELKLLLIDSKKYATWPDSRKEAIRNSKLIVIEKKHDPFSLHYKSENNKIENSSLTSYEICTKLTKLNCGSDIDDRRIKNDILKYLNIDIKQYLNIDLKHIEKPLYDDLKLALIDSKNYAKWPDSKKENMKNSKLIVIEKKDDPFSFCLHYANENNKTKTSPLDSPTIYVKLSNFICGNDINDYSIKNDILQYLNIDIKKYLNIDIKNLEEPLYDHLKLVFTDSKNYATWSDSRKETIKNSKLIVIEKKDDPFSLHYTNQNNTIETSLIRSSEICAKLAEFTCGSDIDAPLRNDILQSIRSELPIPFYDKKYKSPKIKQFLALFFYNAMEKISPELSSSSAATEKIKNLISEFIGEDSWIHFILKNFIKYKYGGWESVIQNAIEVFLKISSGPLRETINKLFFDGEENGIDSFRAKLQRECEKLTINLNEHLNQMFTVTLYFMKKVKDKEPIGLFSGQNFLSWIREKTYAKALTWFDIYYSNTEDLSAWEKDQQGNDYILIKNIKDNGANLKTDVKIVDSKGGFTKEISLYYKDYLDHINKKKITEDVFAINRSEVVDILACLSYEVTFSRLFAHTHKELYIAALNLNSGLTEIFSKKDKDCVDLDVCDAVRVSMSIPYLFTPYKLKNNNNLYTDGGVLDNYPIWVFDDPSFIQHEYPTTSEKYYHNPKTLGFRIVPKSKKDIYEERLPTTEPQAYKNDFLTYSKLLAQAYFNQEENRHHHNHGDKVRTIYIDDCDVSTVEFSLSEIDKKMLTSSGKEGVIDYVRRLHSHPSSPKPSTSISQLFSTGELPTNDKAGDAAANTQSKSFGVS